MVGSAESDLLSEDITIAQNLRVAGKSEMQIGEESYGQMMALGRVLGVSSSSSLGWFDVVEENCVVIMSKFVRSATEEEIAFIQTRGHRSTSCDPNASGGGRLHTRIDVLLNEMSNTH